MTTAAETSLSPGPWIWATHASSGRLSSIRHDRGIVLSVREPGDEQAYILVNEADASAIIAVPDLMAACVPMYNFLVDVQNVLAESDTVHIRPSGKQRLVPMLDAVAAALRKESNPS